MNQPLLPGIKQQLALGGSAVLIALLLFLVMQMLIRPDMSLFQKKGEHAYLNFVRVKPNDRVAETKQRKLPEEPPPPEQPKTPEVTVQDNTAAKSSPNMAMQLPNLNIPLSGGDGPFLGQPGSGMNNLSAMDSDVIPVMQIPPNYPRKAKQAHIEGYVKLSVVIRPDGTVSHAKVIESKPGRLFDKAAINAMYRWKFRPKMVDGKAVSQKAIQVIEFKLSEAQS